MEFSLYCVRRIKCLANYIFRLDFLFFMREDPLVENVFVASDYNETISGDVITAATIGSLDFKDNSTDDKKILKRNKDDREILKRNKQYSQEYNELRKQEGNQIDAKHLYTRSWMQTINLTIGCVVLAVFIYKHK